MSYSKELQAVLTQPEVVPVFQSSEEEKMYAKRLAEEWKTVSDRPEMTIAHLSPISRALTQHADHLNWPGRLIIYLGMTNNFGNLSEKAIQTTVGPDDEHQKIGRVYDILGQAWEMLPKDTWKATKGELIDALASGTPFPKELPVDFDIYELCRKIETKAITPAKPGEGMRLY